MEVGKITLEQSDLEQNKEWKEEFCRIWGPVKTGLELLQKLVKNSAIKSVISIVIATGEAVKEQVCSK